MKIPITDTRRERSAVDGRLAAAGVSVNATALMTLDQVRVAGRALGGRTACGRLGVRRSDRRRRGRPRARSWPGEADRSPRTPATWSCSGPAREVLNMVQADQVGCDIITVTAGPARRSCRRSVATWTEFSLATVKMFRNDAVGSSYEL